MSEENPGRVGRFLAVLTITVVATTPLAVFLFVLGLVVAEVVLYPAASLGTSVIAALVASWAATGIVADGARTDLNAVVIRNLIWAVIPATASAFLAVSLNRAVWLIIGVLIYTGLTATLLAFRHRTTEASTGSDGALSVSWFLGTVVGVGVTIFVASLFGLTGA
jgi:hypothetical protein